MQKERPLLLKGPLVVKTLEGNKRETRRVITPTLRDGADFRDTADTARVLRNNPYGQRGDRLWVRETWAIHGMLYDDLSPSAAGEHKPDCIWYRAHGAAAHTGNCTERQRGKWRPSIHMPRWACRLTLKITAISIEGLHDILCPAIRAEGFDCPVHDFASGSCTSECSHLRTAFATAWNDINRGRGYPWDDNPYVFVVKYEVDDSGVHT